MEDNTEAPESCTGRSAAALDSRQGRASDGGGKDRRSGTEAAAGEFGCPKAKDSRMGVVQSTRFPRHGKAQASLALLMAYGKVRLPTLHNMYNN